MALTSVPGARSAALVWGFPDFRRPIDWLNQSVETLGRDTSNSIALPSKSLSRRHARLRRTGKFWIIEDLDSRNGVFVNAQRVQSTALSPGDVVRCGQCLATFVELPPGDTFAFEDVGRGLFAGPTLRPIVQQSRTLAQGSLSLVLQGETGTGKDRLARAIHDASGRSGRFVPVNCATYQRTTAAAELFGYRRGAFTGAERAHEGHLQAATAGTLFLDEIAELDLDVQAQLLRVLQDGEVLPLGESRAVHVDVRFIAATQKSLAEQVQAGRFRADLRARLEGAVVVLPPLRERREEIAPLFLHLLEQTLAPEIASVDARLLEQLALYDWPLNVRELAALVKRLVTLYGRELPKSVDALQPERDPSASAGDAPDDDASLPWELRRSRDERELRAFLGALKRADGNVSRAAAELSISRQRAYRLLKQAREGGG